MATCPRCSAQGTVSIRPALRAKPIGSFSLAGAQMKVSAHSGVVAGCSSCGLRAFGHLQDPVISEDGTTFVSGYFVADPQQPA